jgi:AcrR family transcriptional regulator
MGVANRRVRHRASLRREIIDAAGRLFVEEGYDRVTMRRIAERIEYSATTIYLHFEDKAELFNAVGEEAFSELVAKLERLKSTQPTPLGCLRAGLKLYIEFGVQHPEHYTVTFLQGPKAGHEQSFEVSVGARVFDALRQAVRACVGTGDIRTSDVEMTTQALWAAIHGLTALFITARGFPFVSHAGLVDHTVDVLVRGLRPPASPGRAVRHPGGSNFID